MLISKKYNKNIINKALEKAWAFDRKATLIRRDKKQNERVVLALTFNPKLLSFLHIIKKH
jgi:hypothetical protein